ncbi:TPA: hypothetical protein ACGTRQ_003799 [Vibrio parahaemolyticus]
MKLQWFRLTALVVLFSGCATTTPPSSQVQSEAATTAHEEQPCSTLRELDYQLHPHRYQLEFEECDASIDDETLIENYLLSLVLTGHFKQLHSSTLFAKLHMDAQQTQQWRLWIEDNHL